MKRIINLAHYISSKRVRPLDKIKLYNEDPDLQLDILSEEYDQLEKKLRNKYRGQYNWAIKLLEQQTMQKDEKITPQCKASCLKAITLLKNMIIKKKITQN